jgi:hypothetical protein
VDLDARNIRRLRSRKLQAQRPSRHLSKKARAEIHRCRNGGGANRYPRHTQKPPYRYLFCRSHLHHRYNLCAERDVYALLQRHIGQLCRRIMRLQGRIDAHNFSLTSGFLTISSNGNPYFEIDPKDDDGYSLYPNPIITIDKDNISINSTDGQLTITTHGVNNKDKAFLRISTDSQYDPDGEDVNNLLCISKNTFYM